MTYPARRRRSHGAERRLADAKSLHADRGLRRAGRQDRRPQALADYTQGGLTNDRLSYTRKLHHVDGRDPKIDDFTSLSGYLVSNVTNKIPLRSHLEVHSCGETFQSSVTTEDKSLSGLARSNSGLAIGNVLETVWAGCAIALYPRRFTVFGDESNNFFSTRKFNYFIWKWRYWEF